MSNVDKIVKDKLSRFEKEPPGYIWDAVNRQMAENRARKRVLVFWQSVAATALILFSLGAGYLIWGSGSKRDQLARTEDNATEIPQKISTINSSEATAVKTKTDHTVTAGKITKNKEKTNKNIRKEHSKTVALNKDSKTKETAFPLVSKDISKPPTEERNTAKDITLASNNGHSNGTTEINSINTSPKFHTDFNLNSTGLHFSKIPGKETPRSFYALNTVTPTPKTKQKKYKFILNGNISPTYNFRNINETQASVVYTHDPGLDESGVVSVAGGLNIRMESKSRWSFETGVLYSQVGQEISQTTVYPSIAGISNLAAAFYSSSNKLKNNPVNISQNANNSLGTISYNNNTDLAVAKGLQKNGVYLAPESEILDEQSDAINMKQLLDYIEIPLMVRYALFNSKPIVTVSGGLSTNFMIDNSAYLMDNGQWIDAGYTEGINAVTYSSTVGLGIEMPLGNSFRFSLEPRFKYFLSPVNNNGYQNFHPYSFGVFGGISFILNNH